MDADKGEDDSNPDTLENESSTRETWGNKAEFILASIGLAVGLGNIWRFPYLCQKNGGGAFLIPYFIMMVIEGLPLFMIELAVGQRFRTSAPGSWATVHPALKGVGVACLVVSGLLCVYYICVMAWCLQYLFASFQKTLPWSINNCPSYPEYNRLSKNCSSNTTCPQLANFSDCCVHDPPLYYFYRNVLNISPSIEDLGDGMQWQLFGYLVLAWVVVYICVVKGIKSSGKKSKGFSSGASVLAQMARLEFFCHMIWSMTSLAILTRILYGAVYITATIPYLILIILFCFGVSLEGSGNGLVALFKPDFSKLSKSQIWLDAASQMFFTLSLGFGAMISFASYNPVKNNCIRDAYTVVLVNCGTSIFAGMVVFSILGHRQFILEQDIDEIGKGPGLVFITFCDAFLKMPIPQLWAVLFFLMLLLLGIDSQFGTLEGFIAPFYDLKLVHMRKELFTGLVAIILLLVGASIMSSSGYFVFQMFDNYSLSIGLLFIALFQTIAVSWVYGNDRFADDIEYMTGSRPNLFWMLCWKYVSPVALIVILISSFYNIIKETPQYELYVGCPQQLEDFSPISLGVKSSIINTKFPTWAAVIVFAFILLPILIIIGWLIRDLVGNSNKWISSFKNKLGTLAEWHPDPSRIDSSKRKVYEDLETENRKDVQSS